MGLLPNPYVIIALIVFWGVSVSAVGWKSYSMGAESERLDRLEDQELVEKVMDEAEKGAAKAIAKLRVRYLPSRASLEKHVRENSVYNDCRHTPGVVQQLNEALDGRPKPVGPGALHPANPPKR